MNATVRFQIGHVVITETAQGPRRAVVVNDLGEQSSGARRYELRTLTGDRLYRTTNHLALTCQDRGVSKALLALHRMGLSPTMNERDQNR
jgi:hypothetical protein